MRSTDRPDDDSQQGPEHIEARPRADRSSVARCNDADLEQTADELEKEREREREKLHTARIDSRGTGARRA